jgi:hypothetical protein
MGALKMVVKDVPASIKSELKKTLGVSVAVKEPLIAVAITVHVCATAPVLSKVTVIIFPAGTVTDAGEKAKSLTVIFKVVVLLGLLAPQAADAREKMMTRAQTVESFFNSNLLIQPVVYR